MANSDSEACPGWNTDPEEYYSGVPKGGESEFLDNPQYSSDEDFL